MKLTSTNKPITCYNSTLFVVWLKTCSRPLCGSRETNRTPPDHPAGSINRSINRGGWGPGRTSRQCFGGHSDGETPGSIPNPEAKPVSADGTARGTGWESRSPPNIHSWVAVIPPAPHTRPPERTTATQHFATPHQPTHHPRRRDRYGEPLVDTIEQRGTRPHDPGRGPQHVRRRTEGVLRGAWNV